MVVPLQPSALYRAWAIVFCCGFCFFTRTQTADSTDKEHHKETRTVTQKVDVIVVGGGLAGICAAISAAEHGASVLVLDRGHGGGTTAVSGGVIYAGGGTAQQKEAGYGDDTANNMFQYLRCEIEGAVDDATLRAFCDDSVPSMEWLESHGVKFSGSLCPFRTSYPTSKFFLFWSGNEKAHPFADVAKPSPRGHRATGGKGTSGMDMTGGVLFQALFHAALRMGVQFKAASRVDELLTDAQGSLVGVKYRAMSETASGFAKHKKLTQEAAGYHGMSMRYFARRRDEQAEAIWATHAEPALAKSSAVILAAGGFVMNTAMTSKHIPWASKVATLGTNGDDGSGIQLGESLGGAVSHMDEMSAWRLLYPPEALVEGIVVSMEGQRIGPEDLYGASLTDIMVRKHHGRGILILDSAQFKKARSQIWQQTQMPWTVFILFLLYWAYQKAASLQSLARKFHMGEPSALEAAVAAYNDAILGGTPDPVEKRNYRSVISRPPFYGIDISLRPNGILMAPALPLGGLAVDGASGLVIKQGSRETIPGLYAAGKNAAGVSSKRYISGLALADCVYSGRRAGRHAATSLGVRATQGEGLNCR